VAVALASQVGRSEVIVCTDGLSNTGSPSSYASSTFLSYSLYEGLGALDTKSAVDKEVAVDFYRRLGALAKQNSVTINVIGIEGEDCGVPLAFLSPVTPSCSDLHALTLGERVG